MMKKMIRYLIPLILFLGITVPCLAGMTSQNYKIPMSVLDGGGYAMNSTTYRTYGSVGQPTPLMNPANPVHSVSYKLYPGFWYTVSGLLVSICECDLNNDGRCNMRDWLVFGLRWGATNCTTVPCACDLNVDGRCNMRDWLIFGEDWGRTNCPITPQ